MSLSVGFPNASAITIGGKSTATVNALSDATAETSTQLLGKEEGDSKQVRTGGAAQEDSKAQSGGDQSIAVKMLLKRMQELQKQLQEQQQQLAAAQAASYPTPEAKATAVMSIQGQIADTNGALSEVSGNLIKELAKGSSSGGLISTTA
jgi:capsule polysaccharide export protein KpsE/RkpR